MKREREVECYELIENNSPPSLTWQVPPPLLRSAFYLEKSVIPPLSIELEQIHKAAISEYHFFQLNSLFISFHISSTFPVLPCHKELLIRKNERE